MNYEIKKKSDYVWTVEKQGSMNVPAVIYSSEKLLNKIKEDKTIQQLINVATLRGIVKHALVMPDAHEGYGFPIGGVGAFDINQGIISPGGVGYDINCGVRLLRTNLNYADIKDKIPQIVDKIFSKVPAGIGEIGGLKINKDELKEVLSKGAEWCLQKGYASREDLETTEEYGCMKEANPDFVSERAFSRGKNQLGTLGSGNHFLEVQLVKEVYDEKMANAFGLLKGQITVMIHCGSRGLGHQIASDYIEIFEEKFGSKNLPDRELVNAPFNSEYGQRYFKAMCSAVNFAFANRQMIAFYVRQAFDELFGNVEIKQVYDVCHNIAKVEEHVVDGINRKLVVHRKGATRSFGPGRKEVPEVYRNFGQPVIIPGSMGTSSYVLVGTKKAEEISFGSTAHGAGRVMSRIQALKQFRGEQIANSLKAKGIYVKGVSWKGIAEEAPDVYKDIDEVVLISHKLGIGNLVAKLVPLGVMKG
ncbi:MAG: RtcB family protein [Candidatus Woesearchaeota archaeon]